MRQSYGSIFEQMTTNWSSSSCSRRLIQLSLLLVAIVAVNGYHSTTHQSPLQSDNDGDNDSTSTNTTADSSLSSSIPNNPLFFFPSSCSSAASLSSRQCCPLYNGSVCGGPLRGHCQAISSICDTEVEAAVWWLTDYFDQTCVCEPHFWGAMCEECAFGWTGNNCDIPLTLNVRRNVRNLTSVQRNNVINALLTLKAVNHSYWPVSVYDWYSAVHAWAWVPLANLSRFPELETADFAHYGPGIFTWHRSILAQLERSIQRTTADPTFALPYWDWTSDSPALELVGGDTIEPDGCLQFDVQLFDTVIVAILELVKYRILGISR